MIGTGWEGCSAAVAAQNSLDQAWGEQEDDLDSPKGYEMEL